MSRHRDVRSMNYSDEYDGYDDVYGHSVEDDYCVSPSAEQFLFDRSKQQNIASFITEPDIVEDDNEVDNSMPLPENKKLNLSELERTKLLSCMETIKNIMGDSISESKLEEEIIQSGFDAKVALDKLLKESPTKTNTETFKSSKDCSDPCPGSTSTFTIPKLSLSQKLQIPNSENIGVSVKGQNNKSESSFSSLADMIASHTNSKKSVQNHSKSSNFDTLADLTAHYLQKSNSTTSNIELCTKSLPSSGFIIPKLNFNKDKEPLAHSTVSSEFKIKNNIDIEINTTNNISKDKLNVDTKVIDSIEKGISNFKFTSDPINELNEKSRNLTKHDVRVPSPDNWLIDLSAALKEVHVPDSKNNNYIKPVTTLYNDTLSYMINNDLLDDSEFKMDIECTLNLNGLRHVRLPYIKHAVSPLGKVLGRKWKLKKPYINYKTQEYRTIKRFDFSTPYTRAKI